MTATDGTPPRAAQPLVLITGSSGLIGTALVADLARDHRVVGLDVQEPAELPASADFVRCDLTHDDGPRAALTEVRARHHGATIASVLHLAAYYDFSGDPSPLYETLTVEGTRRLVRALQAWTVEQLVFSSSLLVMRPASEGQLLDEASPIEAEWDYPRSKLAAERVIAGERGRIPTVILRIAGVYDEECHSIPLAQQIRRIYERKLESYLFPGDPNHGQALVHLEDVVACFRRVIDRRAALTPEALFLIGEPELMSYAQLQDRLGELIHGKEWPTIRIPAPIAKTGAWLKEKAPIGEDPFIKPWMIDLADAHYPVDIRRARERLGWEPCHRLEATLPEMIGRLHASPRRWYEDNGLEPPADLPRAAGERR